MGRVENAFVEESRRVLERLLWGTSVERDLENAQGMRDFDLVGTDGEVKHAIEVTSVQLSAARATRSHLERLYQAELELTASWHIYVHEEAQIGPIQRDAPPLLNLLHDRGITEFDALHRPPDADLADALDRLAAMRITQGRVVPAASPPRLFPGLFGSGSIDAANLTRAVETEVAKDDNRRKLAAAPLGAVRHLVVWLHDSNWYVSILLRSPIAMPPAPLLPSEIDVVWAAVGDGPGTLTCSELLCSDGSGWERIDPVSGVRLEPWGNPAAVGPPDPPPSCPVCSTAGKWEQVTVERVATTGGWRSVTTWRAVCEQNPDHWVMPGREVSAAERARRRPD